MRRSAIIYFFLGLLCIAGVIANISLWFKVATRNERDFNRAVREYLSYFPPFLQDAGVITWICIALCCAAIVLLWFSRPPRETPVRTISTVMIIVAGALLLWLLFTLM